MHCDTGFSHCLLHQANLNRFLEQSAVFRWVRRQKSAVKWIFRTSHNTRFIDPQPRIPSFQVCGMKGTKIQIFSWNPRIHWAGFWRSWFIPLVTRTQRCLFSARVFTPPRMLVLIGGWGNHSLEVEFFPFFLWFFRAESGISEPRHFSKKTDGQLPFPIQNFDSDSDFFWCQHKVRAQLADVDGWCCCVQRRKQNIFATGWGWTYGFVEPIRKGILLMEEWPLSPVFFAPERIYRSPSPKINSYLCTYHAVSEVEPWHIILHLNQNLAFLTWFISKRCDEM